MMNVRIDERENLALDCIKLGKIPLEDIAKCCRLSLDRVKELADSLKS